MQQASRSSRPCSIIVVVILAPPLLCIKLIIKTTPSAAEPGWAGPGVADGVTRSQKSAGRVPPTPPCCPPRHDASAACCSAADLLPFLCHGALQRGPCCVAACSHHLSDQSWTGRVHQGPAIRCPLVGHHHENEAAAAVMRASETPAAVKKA